MDLQFILPALGSIRLRLLLAGLAALVIVFGVIMDDFWMVNIIGHTLFVLAEVESVRTFQPRQYVIGRPTPTGVWKKTTWCVILIGSVTVDFALVQFLSENPGADLLLFGALVLLVAKLAAAGLPSSTGDPPQGLWQNVVYAMVDWVVPAPFVPLPTPWRHRLTAVSLSLIPVLALYHGFERVGPRMIIWRTATPSTSVGPSVHGFTKRSDDAKDRGSDWAPNLTSAFLQIASQLGTHFHIVSRSNTQGTAATTLVDAARAMGSAAATLDAAAARLDSVTRNLGSAVVNLDSAITTLTSATTALDSVTKANNALAKTLITATIALNAAAINEPRTRPRRASF